MCRLRELDRVVEVIEKALATFFMTSFGRSFHDASRGTPDFLSYIGLQGRTGETAPGQNNKKYESTFRRRSR